MIYFLWGTLQLGNNLLQKICFNMSVKKKKEILKNIVGNRTSFMSEQIIVSYPGEKIVSACLKRAILTFVSIPTMWQRDVSFRNFLCSFPYFVIELKPAKLTLLSALEYFSPRKFMMLGALTFTTFFDENIFSGYIFRKEFSKMVQAT